MSTLERAISIAAEAHAGQVDKAGAPYILHPLRVMMSVETEKERIVAVLHDVVEDCADWPLARLRAEGFSDEVLEALASVTKLPHEEADYEAFIRRAATNPIGRRVKIADLKDNMDLSRIPHPTDKDLRRVEKYRRAIEFLEASPKESSSLASPPGSEASGTPRPMDKRTHSFLRVLSASLKRSAVQTGQLRLAQIARDVDKELQERGLVTLPPTKRTRPQVSTPAGVAEEEAGKLVYQRHHGPERNAGLAGVERAGNSEVPSALEPSSPTFSGMELRFFNWESRPAVIVSGVGTWAFISSAWKRVSPFEVVDSGRRVSPAEFKETFPGVGLPPAARR